MPVALGSTSHTQRFVGRYKRNGEIWDLIQSAISKIDPLFLVRTVVTPTESDSHQMILIAKEWMDRSGTADGLPAEFNMVKFNGDSTFVYVSGGEYHST